MKDKIDLLELKLETHMEFHEDISDYYDRLRKIKSSDNTNR